MLWGRQIVDHAWTGVKNGNFWDDDYMKRVWIQAGKPKVGSTDRQEIKSFQAEWNTVWYGSMGDNFQPENGGLLNIGQVTVQQWCEKIASEMTADKVCALGLSGGGANKKGAHKLYINSATWDGTKCSVETADTGRQGNPMGTNVPFEPGTQTWDVSGGPDPVTITYAAGSSAQFWAGRNYTDVRAHCGREYKRYFRSEPESKGAVWD